ncbi:hypothetical protein AY599_15425 [Leptolyngbya valderiana BDU 20041]|nr:hypothetical protein AY599_15425 [Leptolyngbya valderiana BDU 20041]
MSRQLIIGTTFLQPQRKIDGSRLEMVLKHLKLFWQGYSKLNSLMKIGLMKMKIGRRDFSGLLKE